MWYNETVAAADDEYNPAVTVSRLCAKRGWNYHRGPVSDLLTTLNTNAETGLNFLNVDQLRRRHGPNTIYESQSWLRIYMDELLSRTSLTIFSLGLGILAVSYLARSYEAFQATLSLLGIAVYIVLLLLEARSQECFVSARHVRTYWIADSVEVLRDSRRKRVPAQELVPGDIVILSGPMGIPCDIRLLSDDGKLQVNSLPFTGVSKNTERGWKEFVGQSDDVVSARNVLLGGTLCVSGTGRGLVVNTGRNTLLGLMVAHRMRRARAVWLDVNWWKYYGIRALTVAGLVAMAAL